ncbi:MAG: glutaredoxin 3 [Pseudomonadota bacterium]
MAKVEIYTGMLCGYCSAAKRLLGQKGVEFTEIKVDGDPAKRQEMMTRTNGGRTVPQIFINDLHIGGCDDLYDLERAGKLTTLLAA